MDNLLGTVSIGGVVSYVAVDDLKGKLSAKEFSDDPSRIWDVSVGILEGLLDSRSYDNGAVFIGCAMYPDDLAQHLRPDPFPDAEFRGHHI